MAVSEVIARLYDSGMQKLEKKAEAADNEFSQVLNEMEDSEKNQKACKNCSQAAENVESGEIEAGNEITDSEEIATAAGFRFSIFIRTSSSIQSYGNDLMNKFVDATRNFTRALYQQNTEKISGLDAYLQKAGEVTASGQQQTLDFVDQILSAADNGLKMATNSVNAAGMMSGFNLSMNSAIPGTSAADIAGVYLQDALKNGLPTNSVTRTTKSSGLEIVSQQAEYERTSEVKTISQTGYQSENRILDKFLEMLDKMTENVEKPASSISEYSFKFAFSSLFKTDASAMGNEEVVSDNLQEETESSDKQKEQNEQIETVKA